MVKPDFLTPSKSYYGTRRLRVALRKKGDRVGRQRLRPYAVGAYARCNPRPYLPRTTDSTHRLRCALNRPLGQPAPTQPRASGDWAYLGAYQGMVSQQMGGWQVEASMHEELITTAWQRAFWAQPPTPGLLVHADHGGQYCGNAYRNLLHDHQARRSQSRRSDCYDNAPPGTTQAESLWSRLKAAVLAGRGRPVFADLADA